MSSIAAAVRDPKNATVVNAITSVARQLGVDVNLALATAYQESGFNPTAVGDNGSSFGIYQLHRGGELGTLTQAQANDPTRNAQVSLSVVRQVANKSPGASPGTIAAAAQRPANRAGYAASVDSLYSELGGTYLPGLPITPNLPGLPAAPAAAAGAAGPGAVDDEGLLLSWHIPTTDSSITLQRATVRKIIGGAVMAGGALTGLAGAFLLVGGRAPGLAGTVQGAVGSAKGLRADRERGRDEEAMVTSKAEGRRRDATEKAEKQRSTANRTEARRAVAERQQQNRTRQRQEDALQRIEARRTSSAADRRTTGRGGTAPGRAAQSRSRSARAAGERAAADAGPF